MNKYITQVSSPAPTPNQANPSTGLPDVTSLVVGIPVGVLFTIVWNIWSAGRKQGEEESRTAIRQEITDKQLEKLDQMIKDMAQIQCAMTSIKSEAQRINESYNGLITKIDKLESNQEKISMFLAKQGYGG